MNASGVSGKGKQEIKKHIEAHLGPGCCPSRRCIGIVSKGWLYQFHLQRETAGGVY